jgi:glycosyltransferase involved in cell wall biosynthesis
LKLLFLIPARNERIGLPLVIGEIRDLFPDAAILVIDDASDDGTLDSLGGLDVASIRLPRHSGVGTAVRRGLRHANDHGYDTVVRLDADGQHRVDEVNALLGPLRDGAADAVVGSRFLLPAGPQLHRPPLTRRLCQRWLAGLLTALVRHRVTDPTSGFWAFGPRTVRLLATAHPSGYAEPELHLVLDRHRLRVAEVGVTMRVRLAGETSLTFGGAARSSLAMLGSVCRAALPGSSRQV